MKIRKMILMGCIGLLMASCIKNTQRGETYKADGSWKIEKVKITSYDSTGAVTNATDLSDVGFLMLVHEGELEFDGSFSFYVESQQFIDDSPMYYLFTDPLKPANTWEVTSYSKAFNLSFSGYIQGFYTFEPRATFTITKHTNKKFNLRYLRINTESGVMELSEEWEMVRATH